VVFSLKNRVDEVVRIIETTEEFHCHECGHVLESPTPLQKREAISAEHKLDPSLVSIALRKIRSRDGSSRAIA
jgi:hypothetical protein